MFKRKLQLKKKFKKGETVFWTKFDAILSLSMLIVGIGLIFLGDCLLFILGLAIAIWGLIDLVIDIKKIHDDLYS